MQELNEKNDKWLKGQIVQGMDTHEQIMVTKLLEVVDGTQKLGL